MNTAGALGRSAIAAVFVAACAQSASSAPEEGAPTFGPGDATSGDGFHAGSRLRARVQQAEGGATLFSGWTDTALEISCSFALASDNVTRCLPLRGRGDTYADPSCSQPVYILRTWAPSCAYAPPTLIRDIAMEPCGAGRAVRRVEAKLAIGDYYQRDKTGACTATGDLVPWAAYAVSDPIDPQTMLARTDSTNEARGPHYFVNRISAEDGSTELLTSPLDAERNQPCVAGPRDASGGLRCLPLSQAQDWTQRGVHTRFNDAACTTPVATYFNLCTPPAIVVVRDTNQCHESSTSYALPGLRLSSSVWQSPVFGGGSSSCVASTQRNLDSIPEYGIGAPLDPTNFPALKTVDEGTARIRVRSLASDIGEKLTAIGFFDAARNAMCSARRAADGALRCFPNTGGLGYATLEYTDGSCTHAVARGLRGCAMTTGFLVDDPESGVCHSASRTRYFSVGARVTEAVTGMYRRSAQGCVAQGALAGDYYSATELPSSAFAPITFTGSYDAAAAADETPLK